VVSGFSPRKEAEAFEAIERDKAKVLMSDGVAHLATH
jgi:hypothetical protein